jgi:hypothetical protein
MDWGKKIVNDIAMTFYELAHSDSAKEYWMAKDHIGQEAIASVNWEAIDIAVEESKRNRQVFMSKHSSGMWHEEVHEKVEPEGG